MQGVPADQLEVISEKVSYRLAQLPGSYAVLKYVRPLAPTCGADATGYKLANDGQDTRAIQHYLGHRNIQQHHPLRRIGAGSLQDFLGPTEHRDPDDDCLTDEVDGWRNFLRFALTPTF
jgi:hypothetical protein